MKSLFFKTIFFITALIGSIYGIINFLLIIEIEEFRVLVINDYSAPGIFCLLLFLTDQRKNLVYCSGMNIKEGTIYKVDTYKNFEAFEENYILVSKQINIKNALRSKEVFFSFNIHEKLLNPYRYSQINDPYKPFLSLDIMKNYQDIYQIDLYEILGCRIQDKQKTDFLSICEVVKKLISINSERMIIKSEDKLYNIFKT